MTDNSANSAMMPNESAQEVRGRAVVGFPLARLTTISRRGVRFIARTKSQSISVPVKRAFSQPTRRLVGIVTRKGDNT
jgi:hypothetical protein